MEVPQPAAAEPPMQLRIADDIRIRIERGELAPGDSLPTLQELAERWSCSVNSARGAVSLLKQQGLVTGGRGRAPVVRTSPRRVLRSSDRHQAEKDLVHAPEDQRRGTGEAEVNMGLRLDQLRFRATYQPVPAPADLARLFGIAAGDGLLRREYENVDPASGYRESWSVSYIPLALISQNPDLLDANREPWPGGTQHQLSTVGIEVISVVDDVTAHMPTTADAQRWGLDEGVPMLRVRRISTDTRKRVVEVSDAEYPADRTELRFVTRLAKW
jgi:GntR family transcriptional regulator